MPNLKRNITLAIGVSKRIDITMFKGNIYIHINDLKKGKSVTFTKSDFEELLGKEADIRKACKKVKKTSQSEGKKVAKSREIAHDTSDSESMSSSSIESD